MNILLTNATEIFAGGEDYVLVLAKYLRARGHALWIAAQPGHLLLEKSAALGIPPVPMAFRGMDRVFVVARTLRGVLRKNGIDIIHSNANYDRTCAALAAAWTGIPHIAGVHSSHSIQHNLTHWLRNRFGIDHFIVDADAGREVLIREDRIAPGRITTVPIGIEGTPASIRDAARRRTRVHLGACDRTIVIGNVARLVPFKGHRVLLDAIALVMREEPNVLFPVIGDGELLHDLQAQARRLSLEPVLRFLGFQDRLEEVYPAFDLYVHSSLEMAAEMFPIAILRALATELPVVCTRVGGVAAMVREGENGFLVDPERPDQLAHSLLQLIRDAELRRRMGIASGELFRSHYNAATMAERVEGVYTRIREGQDHEDSVS